MDIKGRATRLRPPQGQFAAQPCAEAPRHTAPCDRDAGLGIVVGRAETCCRCRQNSPAQSHARTTFSPLRRDRRWPGSIVQRRSGYGTTKRRLRSSVTCSAGRYRDGGTRQATTGSDEHALIPPRLTQCGRHRSAVDGPIGVEGRTQKGSDRGESRTHREESRRRWAGCRKSTTSLHRRRPTPFVDAGWRWEFAETS